MTLSIKIEANINDQYNKLIINDRIFLKELLPVRKNSPELRTLGEMLVREAERDILQKYIKLAIKIT